MHKIYYGNIDFFEVEIGGNDSIMKTDTRKAVQSFHSINAVIVSLFFI